MFDVYGLELGIDAELGLIVLHVLDLDGGFFGLEDGVVVSVDGEEETCL